MVVVVVGGGPPVTDNCIFAEALVDIYKNNLKKNLRSGSLRTRLWISRELFKAGVSRGPSIVSGMQIVAKG